VTQDLHDRLDDLVSDVSSYVVPDARTAWAAGARRRARHRVAVGAVAAVVLALLAGAAVWLPHTLDPAPAHPDGAGVDGYPARVMKPRVTRDLPDEPGPMAMVYDGPDRRWWTASADGHTWRVPGSDSEYTASLSPDGRLLGYLAAHRSYVVHDLVTGEMTRFDIDGAGSGDAGARWSLLPQTPGFWSPDGRRLLLQTSGDIGEVMLDAQGTLADFGPAGLAAGWLDDHTTAWIVSATAAHPTQLVGVDVGGHVVSRVDLDLSRRVDRSLDQWDVTVSPDGGRLAVDDDDDDDEVLLMSTSDGSLLTSRALGVSDRCTSSWRTGLPLFVAGDGLVSLTDESVTTFDDEAVCVVVASDALDGERYPGIGRGAPGSDWLVARPLPIVAGGVLVLGAVLLVVRRRRRRLAPTS
jgi:hypothetical protein